MITDYQVKKLKKFLSEGKTLEVSAARSGMDEKTARKYRKLDRLPSEIRAARHRHWRTREDPFEAVWEEVKSFFELNNGLEAKTVFEYLQGKYPGQFSDGQLRTFQRRIKVWRAVEGPAKEVYFPQRHQPGKLSQSDFTHMTDLGVTIDGVLFEHLVYHFVLTWSNWEWCKICFSESFESLSEGLQHCLWQLGGVPREHQTDRLSAAVNKPANPEEFTRRYQGLLDHYNLIGRRTNPASPNENGDIEQRHYRFKKAVDQALMLRGSRDFSSRQEYENFLDDVLSQLNRGRQTRFAEELKLLRPLPEKRVEACSCFDVRVGPGSTIRIKHNVYSVHSRLIKEQVTVRLYADNLEVWYGQKCVETIPRLYGSNKHYIQYRHIIDWLIRKPGAFENYRYRSDLFPTSRFRMAYDELSEKYAPIKAAREYLRILELAARENEAGVDNSLRYLLERELQISFDAVEKILCSGKKPEKVTAVAIERVCLDGYDLLLGNMEVAA